MTETEAPAGTAAERISAALQTAVATDDRAATWHAAELVAADWSRRPLTADDGYTDAELDAASAELGHPLPAALREALKLLGRREDLTKNQDPLSTPEDLEIYEGALVFRDENQGVCWWGVLLEDLGQDDPPTYYRPDLADKSEEKWERWTDRLSLAILDAVMAETVIGGFDDEDTFSSWRLQKAGDPADEPGLLALPKIQPDWAKAGWYVGDDVLVYAAGDFACARARSRAALNAYLGDDDDDEYEDDEYEDEG